VIATAGAGDVERGRRGMQTVVDYCVPRFGDNPRDVLAVIDLASGKYWHDPLAC
jgi:hypothetical protein